MNPNNFFVNFINSSLKITIPLIVSFLPAILSYKFANVGIYESCMIASFMYITIFPETILIFNSLIFPYKKSYRDMLEFTINTCTLTIALQACCKELEKQLKEMKNELNKTTNEVDVSTIKSNISEEFPYELIGVIAEYMFERKNLKKLSQHPKRSKLRNILPLMYKLFKKIKLACMPFPKGLFTPIYSLFGSINTNNCVENDCVSIQITMTYYNFENTNQTISTTISEKPSKLVPRIFRIIALEAHIPQKDVKKEFPEIADKLEATFGI